MPEATAIVDMEQVKVALGVTDDSSDLVIERVIDGVTRAIEDHLGRPVVARTVTAEKHDGDGTDTLLLAPPLISITTLINDTITVVAADYVFYAKTGKVKLKSTVFTEGPQKVSVTYRHGWETTAVPHAIRLACINWCIHQWTLVQKDRIGVASKTAGDETITYIAGIPTDVREMLAPYRVMGYAA